MFQVAVILTDAERRILWVNQDFEAITGFRYDEVIGKSPGSVLQGPGSEKDVIDRIRMGLQSGIPFKEAITNYRKDGEPYICKLVIHPIYNSLRELVNFLAFEVDGNQISDEDKIPLMQLNDRYRTSSLRGLEEVQLYEKIRQVMKESRVYLDADLSLRKLADLIDTNTKYLSQVINHFSSVNFLTFINTYRIEAVKQRIKDGEHKELTFFGVAQECGFKNKSTFYKVFRDHTGSTPNEFAKSLVKKEQPSVPNRQSD
ncbi:MAG: PAS domain-containing protein [Bacteroidota bacterium]